MPSLPPTPILLLDQSAAHIGAVVNFRVRHFPQDTELQVTFWQGNSGCGVFTGMLGATGELSGFFKIPPIVNNFTQPGWHNLEASTSGRPATARTQISVTPLPEDQVVELAGSTITSSNAQASVSLSTIRVQPARLSLAISILSHVRDYPIRLHSISVQISAEHGVYHLVTEPFADVEGQILKADSAYQAIHDFVVSQRLPASNPPEMPRLALQAVLGLREHIACVQILRDLEENLVEHLLRDLGQSSQTHGVPPYA